LGSWSLQLHVAYPSRRLRFDRCSGPRRPSCAFAVPATEYDLDEGNLTTLAYRTIPTYCVLCNPKVSTSQAITSHSSHQLVNDACLSLGGRQKGQAAAERETHGINQDKESSLVWNHPEVVSVFTLCVGRVHCTVASSFFMPPRELMGTMKERGMPRGQSKIPPIT
jgi:hypothetical protein